MCRTIVWLRESNCNIYFILCAIFLSTCRMSHPIMILLRTFTLRKERCVCCCTVIIIIIMFHTFAVAAVVIPVCLFCSCCCFFMFFVIAVCDFTLWYPTSFTCFVLSAWLRTHVVHHAAQCEWS